MKRIVIGVVLAVVLVMGVGSSIVYGDSTDITVTAVPGNIEFSSSPDTWTLNDIHVDDTGVIDVDTLYYSNPLGGTTAPSATVLDSECQFTWTNGSTIDIDIFVTWGSFTGGDADMTNGDTGSNGESSYGAHAWYSGMTYANKVVTKSSGSTALEADVTPATTTKKWGVEIETRTNAWAGVDSSTSTLTISASA